MVASPQPRLVVVTGAAAGIGRATADLFLARGWRVLAADIQPAAASWPEGVHSFQSDLARPDQIETLAAEVGKLAENGLQALVNNAAIQLARPMLETGADDWDAVLDVNLRAPFWLTRALYPQLKRAQGAIVNVSSVHAYKTSAEMSSYAASKGGLLGLTRRMAAEFAADGLRANAVLPGATRTDMLMHSMQRQGLEGGGAAERLQILADKIPLKRLLEPDEVAQAVYFLADGEQSGSITGAVLVADGGALAL